MLSTIVALLTAASTVTPAGPSTFHPVVRQQLFAPGSDALRLELGTLSEPLRGELSKAALAWALKERARYGLPADSTLRSGESFGTRFGASFHLVQQVAGVDVYDAKLVVTVDARAQVVQVASSLAQYEVVRSRADVGLADALALAAANVPLPAMRTDGSGLPYGGAKKLMFEVEGELHVGWLVHVATLDRTKNWYLGVDAVKGEVLFRQNRVHTAALDANVYPISPGGLDAGVGATPTVTRELKHGDGGTMVAASCQTSLRDGGVDEAANDGGYLCGDQLTMFNCCASQGCVPDAGPARAVGATTFQGVPVQYDIAVCERVRRATNDPAVHPSGSYEYTPVDPPVNASVVDPADPANSDEFAEVHAFYHLNRVYDWARALSTTAAPIFPSNQPAIVPFMMRDERRVPSRHVAVWANAIFPNFNELLAGGFGCITNPPCRANTLLRMDNAAFMPVEQFDMLPLPEFETGVDTLMIFQGNSADAAYDAMVVQHEFGHGMVYSTSNLGFDTVALDQRSANNETGALHEAFADYVAGAFNDQPGVGPYFGPRISPGATVPGVEQEQFLRTMTNTLTCPEVLWGEVHQDSQHVSAALWQGRSGPFAGSDNGATFDATFYAMLVSLGPNADFAQVATVMADRVATAFPTIATAGAQMTQIFSDKGVIGCSKIIDITGATTARPYYGVPQAPNSLRTALVPGPYQMKLRTPNGVARVRVTAQVGSGNPLAPAPGAITTLVRSGHALTFTRSGNTIANDAERQVATAAAGGNLSSTVDISVPCGPSQEIYVSLANQGGGATLQNVRVQFDPPASCTPDAGTDGGVDGGVDGGGGETTTVELVGSGGVVSQKVAAGCGCSSAVEAAPLLLLALLRLSRRRQLRGNHG